MSLHQAKKRFYSLYQGHDTSNAHFLDKFTTRVLVVEQFGGNIGKDNGAMNAELDLDGITNKANTTPVHNTTSTHKIEATQGDKDKCLTVVFLSAADKSRYGKMLEDLEKYYMKDSNNYPPNVTSTYNLKVNYKNFQRTASRLSTDSEGVSCANIEKGNQDKSVIKCYNCNYYGQYANECTTEDNMKKGKAKEGFIRIHAKYTYNDIKDFSIVNMMDGDGNFAFVNMVDVNNEYMFHQSNTRQYVPPNLILLDNQSMTDIFCNKALLSNTI
jgi:hypothetical protein